MVGNCRALVSLEDGANELLTGTKLAISPYRLFRLLDSELSPRFTQEIQQKANDFDLILTDEKGREFFTNAGVSSDKLIPLPDNLITSWEISKAQERISYYCSGATTKKGKISIWNAMSMFFDRQIIFGLQVPSANTLIEDFAEIQGVDTSLIPKQAWIPVQQNIYPVTVPVINLTNDLDFLVIDCPARNLSLLPNGVAYLETSLRKNGVNYQVLDLDVIAYHMFHMHRIFDLGGSVKVGEVQLPEDPWLAHNYDVWSSISEHENRENEESALPMHRFFDTLLEKAADEIHKAKPRIVGFSIQQCSEVMSARLIRNFQNKGLSSPVIVGGFSCYNFDIGLRGFPLADYMCIGEAETTISNLISKILNEGTAKDLAGVLSRYDTPGREFSAAPMIHNLDTIEFPTYSWTDLKEYVNWDGYQLIPIIASRGCRWSRCTFCAERFYWRIRSAKDFVDELEWHVFKGHYLFMFNESDLNGMPERVLEICDEIIARGLHKKVKLTGQLRIHRKSDAAFFAKLRAAGFVALRFGVDSFSRNGMKLQQKGYTPEIVAQNLKDCSEAGIFVEVNWVIGVPGEKESDIDEGIQFILENKKFIGRLANLNPLILVNGSVYWLNPDDYNIHFKESWEELKKKFPRAIPAGLWWSEDPFIDSSVRQRWFQKVVKELFVAGFPIGDWAKQVIEDVETRKDGMRSDKNTVDEEASGSHPKNTNGKQPLPIDLGLEGKGSFATPPSSKEYTFVQSFSGYAIYSIVDMYYALHESISAENIDLELVAIHRSENLEDLKEMITDAVAWANSRGAYGDSGNATIKVDSNLSRFEIFEEIESSLNSIIRVSPTLFFGIDELEPRRSLARKYTLSGLVSQVSHGLGIDSFTLKNLFLRAKNKVDAPNPSDVSYSDIKLFSIGASPELVASWDDQKLNIVRFDGMFYAVPHGLQINFEKLEEYARTIGALKFNKNLQELMQDLEFKPKLKPETNSNSQTSLSTGESFTQPKLIKTIKNYNIVGFEGFYYAIPHFLGEVHLEKMDTVEDTRIFRDVSIYAVEDFVLESTSF